MSAPAHLLHAELFNLIPLQGSAVAGRLETYAGELSREDIAEPGLSVAIRTLNETPQLAGLLDDLQAQKFAGEVELIVVDNGSTDGLDHVARQHGATVVTLPRTEFTYPRSLNLCMEAASHDLVYLLVGHVNLSNDQALRGGVRHFADPANRNVGGAYAFPPLPNANASLTERAIITGAADRIQRAARLKRAGWGTLAANSAMISKPVWLEAGGFDEAYEAGAEDVAMAKTMMAAGFEIWREPTLSVHHTHGLGFLNRMQRTLASYRSLRGPVALDRAELEHHRPDLRIAE